MSFTYLLNPIALNPDALRRYRGSADAVRQNLDNIFDSFQGETIAEDILIVSGHGLYDIVRPYTLARQILMPFPEKLSKLQSYLSQHTEFCMTCTLRV